MSGRQNGAAVRRPSGPEDSKIVHIYQVRPEMALEHLQRTTGLDFESLPESLVNELEPRPESRQGDDVEPPTLTDVVDHY